MFSANYPGAAYPGDGYAGPTTTSSSGTATSPLGALTSTATGVRTGIATAAALLGALVSNAAGVRTVSRAASAPLGALTSVAISADAISGTASAPLGALTSSVSGVRTTSGTASAPLGALTAAASGTRTVTRTATSPLGTMTSAATGTRTVPGAASAPLGALVATVTGIVIAPPPGTSLQLSFASDSMGRTVVSPQLDGIYQLGFTSSAIGAMTAAAPGAKQVTFDSSSVGRMQASIVGSFPLSFLSASTDAFRILVTPDIAAADVDALLVAVTTRAHPVLVPPDPRPFGWRSMPTTVIVASEPAIVEGRPQSPRYWARSPGSGVLIEGPNHIHAIANPDPYHAPKLPQPGVVGSSFHAIWRVGDLPLPKDFPGGWYWLGRPSTADGTANIPVACRQWNPSAGSSSGTPALHSRYPFKPSVVSAAHWLYGGGTADHPKAVNFNSQFIEHMWLDWGADRKQPFTWLVVAMVPTYPRSDYTHHILDAGRNPFDLGLGQYGASDCYSDRPINDGLGYRTLLTATKTAERMTTSGANGVSAKHTSPVRPRMYFATFNGSHSAVGNYAITGKYRRAGAIANGAAQKHRYTIIGRKQGQLSQNSASHLLVFEIRYWNKALTDRELADQYDYFASVYHFARY